MEISVPSTESLSIQCFQVELEFGNVFILFHWECWFLWREGNRIGHLEKNPWSKDENRRQTQPTYGVNTGNRTLAILVGGDCPYH